jgi:hypothetical protein
MGLVTDDPVEPTGDCSRHCMYSLDTFLRESDTPITQNDVSIHGEPSEKDMYVERFMKAHPGPMVPAAACSTVADGVHPMSHVRKFQEMDSILSVSSGSTSNDTGYGEDSPTMRRRESTQIDERLPTVRPMAAVKRGSIGTGPVVATGNVRRQSTSSTGRRASVLSVKESRNSPDVAAIPVGSKTESHIGSVLVDTSPLPTENEPSIFERHQSPTVVRVHRASNSDAN